MSILRRFVLNARREPARSPFATTSEPGGAEPSPVAARSQSLESPLLVERSLALASAGRLGEAYRHMLEALEGAPDEREVLRVRGSILLKWSRFLEARAALERASAAGMQGASFLSQLGEVRYLTGDFDGAQECLRNAIHSAPEDAGCHSLLALVLLAKGQPEDAAASQQRALELQPDDFQTVFMLGSCRIRQGRFADAEALFRRALAIDGERAAAWTNLGLSLTRQERHSEALPAYERAARLERIHGEDADGFVNVGVALHDAGRLEEAIAAFESGLAERPTAAAHFNYSMALLRAGRLADGWVHHEFRWLTDAMRGLRLKVRAPVWNGQDLDGKVVMIRAEQGFGDTFQFLRYAPMLKALGATVVVRTQAGLEEVARGCAGVDRVLAQGAESPEFDYYIHPMTLPRVFGTDLANVPADVPYLRVDPVRAARWSSTLSAGQRFKVGLIWAGNPGHIKDRYRSIPLALCSPILDVPDVEFFALQKGPQLAELDSIADRSNVRNLGPELNDFADAAAVIAQLDLVICVDTAPAHLAGALGKPVWLLLPTPCDWRWLDTREDSPWYPTMRLFRQTRRGDWSDPIARVAGELRDLAVRGNLGSQRVYDRDARSNEVPRCGALPAPPDHSPYSAVAETRTGIVQYVPQDAPEGESIRWYGEYLQPQLDLLLKIVRPGATVVEVRAGVGVHSLGLASAVGESGHLILYEPRPLQQRILAQNLGANEVRRVTLMRRSLGRQDRPDPVPGTNQADTLDDLGLERLDLLKFNAGVAAAPVLDGAGESLWRLRPTLFISAEDSTVLADLAATVREFGYRCWRMDTPLFHAGNFNRRTENVFGDRSALALLAIAEEIDVELSLTGCVEFPG